MSQISETQPVQKTDAPKKRGWKFWLGAVVIVLIALPLLAWLGVWAYLNFGFVNNSIESKIAQRMGTTAHVGAVKSSVFSGINVETVTVDALDKGAPITIDAMRVEWDAADFFSSGKMRSVSIDGPNVELRRVPNSGWNFKLNPSGDSEGGGRILRLNISNGRFASDLWGSGKVAFENIRGSGSHAEGRGPNPFYLSADFMGRAPWSVSGSVGPGAGPFDVRVLGEMKLERDLPGLAGFDPGAAGDVRFELSARREPFEFGGRINLKNVSVKLPGGGAIEIPADDWDLQGDSIPASKEGESAVKNWRLSSGRLGRVAGSADWSANELRITDVSGSLDLAAVEGMCATRWPDAFFSVRGTADVSGGALSVPLGDGAKELALSGRIQARRLCLSVPEFGDLPPVDARVDAVWPHVRSGSIKLGDVASVEFLAADVRKIQDVVALAENIRVGKFSVDLGQFFEAEIVRRILARTAAGSPAPSLRDAAWSLTGAIGGPGLTTKWSTPFLATGSSSLNVSGMNALNLGVVKWPLGFRAPALRLSGAMVQNFDFENGKLAGVALESDLKSQALAGDEALSMKLSARVARGESGGWSLEPVELQDVKIPFAVMEKSLGILDGTGIVLNGGVQGGFVLYDPSDGSARGVARVAGGGEIPLGDGVRGGAVTVLRLMSQGLAASVLESLGVVDRIKVNGFNAEIEFQSSGKGSVEIKGHVKPFELAVLLPLVGERRVAQIPPIEFKIDSQLRPEGVWFHVVSLNCRGVNVDVSIEQLADGECKFNGNFSEDASEIAGAFSGAFNLKDKLYGPFHLTVPKLDLAVLGPLLVREQNVVKKDNADEAKPKPKAARPRLAWSGAVERIGVHTERFKWSGGLSDFGVRATARFADATFSGRGLAFEKVRGTFTGVSTLGSENASVDALLSLDAFTARVDIGDDEFIVPSPAGQNTALKLALKIPRSIASGGAVRLENGDLDFGGLLNFTARSGTMTLAPGGAMTSAEMGDVILRIGDFKALQDVLEPANEALAEKLIGDVKLAGKGSYSGLGRYEGDGRFGLKGTLKLENGVLPTGARQTEKSSKIEGEIPVQVRVKFEDGKVYGQRWKIDEEDDGRLVEWPDLFQQMKDRAQ